MNRKIVTPLISLFATTSLLAMSASPAFAQFDSSDARVTPSPTPIGLGRAGRQMRMFGEGQGDGQQDDGQRMGMMDGVAGRRPPRTDDDTIRSASSSSDLMRFFMSKVSQEVRTKKQQVQTVDSDFKKKVTDLYKSRAKGQQDLMKQCRAQYLAVVRPAKGASAADIQAYKDQIKAIAASCKTQLQQFRTETQQELKDLRSSQVDSVKKVLGLWTVAQ